MPKRYTPFSLFMRQALMYPPAQKNYPADQQFIDNGDGTISDLSTGLMWAKDGNGPGCNNGGTLDWEDAVDFAEALEFAGYDDWYLPEIKELETIVDYSAANPAIDPTAFPNCQSSYYWSSTTHAHFTDYAWFVYFYDGYVIYDAKTNEYYVRPVRQY